MREAGQVRRVLLLLAVMAACGGSTDSNGGDLSMFCEKLTSSPPRDALREPADLEARAALDAHVAAAERLAPDEIRSTVAQYRKSVALYLADLADDGHASPEHQREQERAGTEVNEFVDEHCF